MGDPASEIRHLLERYQEAMAASDLDTLAELHWQDPRFIHLDPLGPAPGWSLYEERLKDRFRSAASGSDFRLTELHIEMFHGKFASAWANWRQGSGSPRSGRVLFVLSRMGSTWKIVADHHAGPSVSAE